jgi:hypothetical protein
VRKPLDVRTLRAVSRRLRARTRELDAKIKRHANLLTGRASNPYTVGRACEAELQADNLLSEARAISKKSKGAKK